MSLKFPKKLPPCVKANITVWGGNGLTSNHVIDWLTITHIIGIAALGLSMV